MRYGSFTKRSLIWMVTFFASLTLATSVTADQITLTNGDIIKGQLKQQTDTHVIWSSDSFGTLTIAQEQIASINGESFGEEPAEIFSNTYEGSLSFTGAYASGNQEREDWDLDSGVKWRDGDFRHGSSLNYETHRLNNSPKNREYAVNYVLDWFFQDQWFWSNGVSFGANEERAIDNFYYIGSSLGRQFWESKSTALSASTGLLWLSEDFEDQSTDRRLTWSWSADYRALLINNIQLFHSHKVFIALTDFGDSDLSADLGIKIPVVKNLFAEVKLEWDYDNQPAVGKEKSDSQLTMGVNYSW